LWGEQEQGGYKDGCIGLRVEVECIYLHISLVPRPRPTFCYCQYGRASDRKLDGAWEGGYLHIV